MPRRFRAPVHHGEILAEPGFDAIPVEITENRKKLNRPDVSIAGVPLPEFRRHARAEILSLAGVTNPDPDAPLLLSGHQPELCHPGVWAKHFALNGLAKRVGGVPLNLIVDHDTLKSPIVKFPVWDAHTPTNVRLEGVAFDCPDRERTYESRRILDAECFATFAERSSDIWKHWGFELLLNRVWPTIVANPAKSIGERFAAARHDQEVAWGCENLELPVSALTRTEAFAAFVFEILTNAERFRDCHNAAVREYRKNHGLRSVSHPVPELVPDELPFWIVHEESGIRERPVSSSLVEPHRLRPRAITLTLFARLCLGDYFIHGIGGGKYDEVTDAILRRFFGVEPPAFQVLSATLHLPFAGFPTTSHDLAALARSERDLHWNPHRHLSPIDAGRTDIREWINRHRELEAVVPAEHAVRLQRFAEFRRIGEHLRPEVAPKRDDIHEWRERAEQELAANAVLRRRDFPWLLYPEEMLRPFLQRFL